ncbi:hypothetical protein BGW80DRAFT_540110 [Lactifluus volemus]|nr:hypothetical protein BGW80DRAFT_540110 [Lactifluus volemus]
MRSLSRRFHSPSPTRSPSPEISLSVTTTPSKLIKVARFFEFEKNEALAEVQALRRKLALITNLEEDGSNTDAPPSKRRRSNSKDHDGGNDGAKEDKVIQAGHQFAILHSLWLQHDDNAEKLFSVEFDPTSDESERFESTDNMIQGQLREIREVLGMEASEVFEPWVAKAVSPLVCAWHDY